MSDDEVNVEEGGKNNCTLADIACVAGVSKSTVSLALRSDPRVAEETRQRIQKIASKLGYRPNPALSSLASYRWSKEGLQLCGVAYIVGALQEEWTYSEREYFSGACRAANSLGYHLEAFCLMDYPSVAAMERVLKARGIRGLLMAPVLHSRQAFSMKWDDFTAIACGLGLDVFPLDMVIPDIYHSLRSAVTHVVGNGYRRLGLALMFHQGPSLNDQYRYAAALLEQQLCLRNPCRSNPHSIDILTGDSREIPELIRWLQAGRFDVVLGLSDDIGKAMAGHGFRIPEDLAFVSLHKADNSLHIAGVDSDRQGIGEAAMRLLDLKLRKNQTGATSRPGIHMIHSIWRDGATLPPHSSRIEPVR